MSALLGVAIASMFIGMASDKVGRKPCMLLCLYGTAVGCILKYLFRFSFWPYCGFNFLNGLFSASVPVSLAYAGDVNETKREKDSEIGVLVGISMLGAAGGGIIAILMETQGLFVVSVNFMYLILHTSRYSSKSSFLMHLLYYLFMLLFYTKHSHSSLDLLLSSSRLF